MANVIFAYGVDFDIEKIGDTWEELVTSGIEVASAQDKNRFLLGDIALKVERNYRERSLEEFARAINVRRTAVYDYSRVSKFYPKETRDFPMCSWSHYRAAMRAGQLAFDWLEECAANGWPVGVFVEKLNEYLGKPNKPRKLLDMKAYVVGLNPDVLTLKIDRAIHDALVQARAIGDVRLVLYEVE